VLSHDSSIGCLLVSTLQLFLNTLGGVNSLERDGSPTQLAAAIEQQLQQAGLYKHLSQILTGITAQLAAAQPSAELLVALEHSPTAKHGDKQGALETILQDVHDALMLYSLLQLLFPYDDTPGAWDPSIDAAAMSLALSAAQQVSKWLDALPADSPEPHHLLPALLTRAFSAVTECMRSRAAGMADWESQLARFGPLLLSEQYGSALCVAMCMGMHYRSVHAEAEAEAAGSAMPAGAAAAAAITAAATCSGSSAASSSSARLSKDSKRPQGSSKKGPGRSSKAAGNACSRQQRKATAGSSSGRAAKQWARACALAQQLPPRQQELLQALNCSSKVLLWDLYDLHSVTHDDPSPVEAMTSTISGLLNSPDMVQESIGCFPANRCHVAAGSST
jgi:hypothetical protein